MSERVEAGAGIVSPPDELWIVIDKDGVPWDSWATEDAARSDAADENNGNPHRSPHTVHHYVRAMSERVQFNLKGDTR